MYQAFYEVVGHESGMTGYTPVTLLIFVGPRIELYGKGLFYGLIKILASCIP